jgi:excisionase family DNA binding protein
VSALTGIPPRLLTPHQAAAYLSLGSRWAIYRLVEAGDLPRLKLAGKLRFDREDLDRLIDLKKGRQVIDAPPRRPVMGRARGHLAPLSPRTPRRGDSSVTPGVEVAVGSVRNHRTTDISSGALSLGKAH